MDTRRKVLKKIGLSTAAAGLVGGGAAVLEQRQAATSEADAVTTAPDPQAGQGPWWLLAPLKRGDHLGHGWHLSHLGPVQRGASVLTMQNTDGDVARVHLCHHEGTPRGLAHTELLDMILMDGGQGEKQTEERIGTVLLGLAEVIRGNELHSEGDLSELARMQPHGERVDAYGPESLT